MIYKEVKIWIKVLVLILAVPFFNSCKPDAAVLVGNWVELSVFDGLPRSDAAGFCRGGNPEFKQFLKISKGSAAEVKSMYYIAEDQGYIVKDTAIARRTKAQYLINGNAALIKYLKSYK